MSELLARLRGVMRGDSLQKTPVTRNAPVTLVTGYRSKPPELQALQPLQVKNSKLGNDAIPAEPGLPESIRDAIEARPGMCAGSIPAPYLDAWARLNHQQPMKVSEADWRRALDDGGGFLDAWGNEAALWGWTVAELFDVPREGQRGGLLWFIAGAKVEAFGPDHARLSDERIFDRGTVGGMQRNG